MMNPTCLQAAVAWRLDCVAAYRRGRSGVLEAQKNEVRAKFIYKMALKSNSVIVKIFEFGSCACHWHTRFVNTCVPVTGKSGQVIR